MGHLGFEKGIGTFRCQWNTPTKPPWTKLLWLSIFKQFAPSTHDALSSEGLYICCKWIRIIDQQTIKTMAQTFPLIPIIWTWPLKLYKYFLWLISLISNRDSKKGTFRGIYLRPFLWHSDIPTGTLLIFANVSFTGRFRCKMVFKLIVLVQ